MKGKFITLTGAALILAITSNIAAAQVNQIPKLSQEKQETEGNTTEAPEIKLSPEGFKILCEYFPLNSRCQGGASNTTKPDTTTPTPDGGMTAPDTTTPTPDGGMTAPDTTAPTPDGGMTAPDTTTPTPDGGMTAPGTNQINPMPDSTLPDPNSNTPGSITPAPNSNAPSIMNPGTSSPGTGN